MPRCRSPAIAAVANPTAKTDDRMIAIGWMKPMAIAPGSENRSPPPNWASCLGMRPLFIMSRNCEPKWA